MTFSFSLNWGYIAGELAVIHFIVEVYLLLIPYCSNRGIITVAVPVVRGYGLLALSGSYIDGIVDTHIAVKDKDGDKADKASHR
ncbi:hypothetical protein ES703_110335 [subsurface metagenome]